MQMAFDISSKLIKGSNKLKVLTRRNFGHETPELTDILGKGNEYASGLRWTSYRTIGSI